MAAGRQRTFLTGEICQQFLNTGKYLYVPNYGRYYTVENFKKLGLRLLSLRDIFANPGVYTWILFNIDGEYVFKAIKSYSSLELLTKHNNILEMYKELSGREDISDESILFAGEAYTRGGQIFRYNFLSGTYMLARLGGKELKELYKDAVVPFESYMKTLNSSLKMVFSPEIKTFIPDNIGYDEYENILKPLDMEAYLFDSREKCIEQKSKKLQILKSKYESMLKRNIRQLTAGNKFKNPKLTEGQILLEAEKRLITQKEKIDELEREDRELKEGKFPGVEKVDYTKSYQIAGKKKKKSRKTMKKSKTRKLKKKPKKTGKRVRRSKTRKRR